MITHLKELQLHLKINLREMIDHALTTHTLKVMRAYIQRLEVQIKDVEDSIEQLEAYAKSAESRRDNFGKWTAYWRLQHQIMIDAIGSISENIDKSVKIISRHEDSLVENSTELSEDNRQWEVKQYNILRELHPSLQKRLQVTQAIYDSLYPSFQTDDSPTLDEAVLQSVYQLADEEKSRIDAISQTLDQHDREAYAYDVRWRYRAHFHYWRGPNSRFRFG